MNEKLKEKTREALTSVLPITVIVLMLSVTLVRMEVGTLALFLTGAVLLIVGMGFFQLGAEISMTPLGQGIGGSIVRQKKTWLAVVICFAMGAIITISEPDLQVLANQVAAIPNAVLIWTVAAGVGVFTAVAVLLISLVICSITVQRMVDPLKGMCAFAHKFAHGEVDTRITEYTNRKDEIGELAIAFNAMADSLAQAEQKRSEFVANVSHELKTPMTTIAGFADGILDGTIPPEKERESLQVISSETRRLSRLVRRMLELSRLQSSERVAAQEQFDVAEVLLRVLVSLESKITEKDLDVQTQLPDGPVMVWGDPDAVTQVCYNLLDNAVKFSSPQGRLTLRITTKAGKAYIAIGNQGETIPPQQLTHIFDRFHKADSSRSTHKDGVGLGLYIVKTILNTYKEDITVTSQDGFTEFTFTLSEV